jgi:transcriptional regulator with XRE-family HTH domain
MNISKLKKAIEKSNLTNKEIAERCGFSSTTLYGMLKGDDVKISTVEKIASVLGVPVGEFFTDGEQPSSVRVNYDDNRNDVTTLMNILSRFLRNQEQYHDIMKDMMAIYERINK